MPPRKRSRPETIDPPSRKKAKTAARGPLRITQRSPPPINTPPTQRLDIYIFGSGEQGELGLGTLKRNVKKPKDVRRPRLNDLLDAETVGVVQISVGGMHCIALTYDDQILTWGVNDNGALGRATYWEAPEVSIDDADDSGFENDENAGFNPLESTPGAVPRSSFAIGEEVKFVQVVATDSASFVLTSEGNVYGWGTFRVSVACSVTIRIRTNANRVQMVKSA